jgi:hypothetical protein
LGTIPQVTADWQWSGHWPVTTDALMVGAWQAPKEKKLLLLLVNVGDQPIQATLVFDAARYDLPPGPLTITGIGQGERGEPAPVPRAFQRAISTPPRQARAWEIGW